MTSPKRTDKGSSLEDDLYDSDGEFRAAELTFSSPTAMVKKQDTNQETTAFWSSKVNRLWNVCESSTANAKIFLADSVIQPFYLQKPKGSKPRTEADILREQVRIEKIALREVSTSGQASNSAKYIPTPLRLSSKEE